MFEGRTYEKRDRERLDAQEGSEISWTLKAMLKGNALIRHQFRDEQERTTERRGQANADKAAQTEESGYAWGFFITRSISKGSD